MREQQPIPEASGRYPESAFVNRELSQLSFFDRVLNLAERDPLPLLERLRFLTIFSAILDEFFEIRVAGLKERLRLRIDRIGPDGLSARDLLTQINREVTEMTRRQYTLLNDQILPALSDQGVAILKRSKWTKLQREWVRAYFREQVVPVLTPVGLDPAHPFPQVLNKSLNMLLSLEGEDEFGRACEYAVLHVPRCLPRVIELPVEIRSQAQRSEFVLLSSVIHAHANEVFPGIKVKSCHQFRVTRHADLSVDEEEVEDLLDALKGELPGRRYGEGVRLEIADTCPPSHVQFLLDQFGLDEDDLYQVNGPVNLTRLSAIVQMVDRPDLKYSVFVPTPINTANHFEQLHYKNILLHHPFQSFSPVVELVKTAAQDPCVLAIKQTLYRTGSESPFVDALIEAARAGKEVTAVIELRARFDEAANIDIASRLQQAGAHVVYGVVGYKTHAKMLMIVRREGGEIKRYVHLATGNYHTGTARAYTDFGLITADQQIGADVHQIFLQLTGVGTSTPLKRLISAPFGLYKQLKGLIQHEIKEAKAGRPARIVIKLNSVSDPAMIEHLYQASCAGVKIDLIVRGICCLTPGLEGISQNIRVRSVLGRFLEHTRVYYFWRGGEEPLYLASADLMQRNLYRRVEVAFPIEDPEHKERLIQEGLQIYLDDTMGAWEMLPNGAYTRSDTRGRPVRLFSEEVEGAAREPQEPRPEELEAQQWLISCRAET